MDRFFDGVLDFTGTEVAIGIAGGLEEETPGHGPTFDAAPPPVEDLIAIILKDRLDFFDELDALSRGAYG